MAEVRCSPVSYFEQQKACQTSPLRPFKMWHLGQFPQRTSTPLEGSCLICKTSHTPFLCFKPFGPGFPLTETYSAETLQASGSRFTSARLRGKSDPVYAIINGMKWIEVRTRTFCISGANLYMVNGSSQTNDLLEREPGVQVYC